MVFRLAAAALLALLSCLGPAAPGLTEPAPEPELAPQNDRPHRISLDRLPVAHQGIHRLNIHLDYAASPAPLAPAPASLQQAIQTFLAQYPNEDDYWEIVNRRLAQTLIAQYPQLTTLSLEMGVLPCDRFPHPRGSIVTYEAGEVREFWYFSMPIPAAALASPFEAAPALGPTLTVAYEYWMEDKALYPDYNAVITSIMATWRQPESLTRTAFETIADQIRRDHGMLTNIDINLNQAIAAQ
ncbi:MAG: hypothetical protein AAF289_15380 [Cyanobacteria bacterium P01_A01_bin.135]